MLMRGELALDDLGAKYVGNLTAPLVLECVRAETSHPIQAHNERGLIPTFGSIIAIASPTSGSARQRILQSR